MLTLLCLAAALVRATATKVLGRTNRKGVQNLNKINLYIAVLVLKLKLDLPVGIALFAGTYPLSGGLVFSMRMTIRELTSDGCCTL